jgi:hypothetical protein
MNLPPPPARYDQKHSVVVHNEIERADSENFKRYNDVELRGTRLILSSPDGTRWQVSVDNSGVIQASPL